MEKTLRCPRCTHDVPIPKKTLAKIGAAIDVLRGVLLNDIRLSDPIARQNKHEWDKRTKIVFDITKLTKKRLWKILTKEAQE